MSDVEGTFSSEESLSIFVMELPVVPNLERDERVCMFERTLLVSHTPSSSPLQRDDVWRKLRAFKLFRPNYVQRAILADSTAFRATVASQFTITYLDGEEYCRSRRHRSVSSVLK